MSPLLEHPLVREVSLSGAEIIDRRRLLIHRKRFLHELYREWYRGLAGTLPDPPGAVLELGSGAGFLAEVVPGVVTSDVVPCRGIDLVADACSLPVTAGSVRAVVLVDVLHHLADPIAFLAEAARCVRPGGVVTMVEPWVTSWSRLVYRHLHHEPFDDCATSWSTPVAGPLAGANGALPWILFARDWQRVAELRPEWRRASITPMMPFAYLASGGVSRRSLLPGGAYRPWRWLERVSGLDTRMGMFAHIVLRRVE